jgi:hypothetical protein
MVLGGVSQFFPSLGLYVIHILSCIWSLNDRFAQEVEEMQKRGSGVEVLARLLHISTSWPWQNIQRPGYL